MTHMPNPSTLAAEHDALLMVSGCWEVTDPQPHPLCCWKAGHHLGECAIVRELRAEVKRLRARTHEIQEAESARRVESYEQRLAAARANYDKLWQYVEELRKLNETLAERVAGQAELLAKRAEQLEPDTMAVIKAAEEAAK